MLSGGERAYAYAKACGIIGKSFVGKRVSALREMRRLSDLDRLVFQGGSRELPERELLPDLEDRFAERAVQAITSIVECFSRPPRAVTLLLRSFEYQDMKRAVDASLAGATKQPPFTDLGHFRTVNFAAWPDVPAMVTGTEFDFLLEKDEKNRLRLCREKDGVPAHTLLDKHYYKALWEALLDLPSSDRRVSEALLGEEISLLNAGWVLRLRSYYGMSSEEVKRHLVYIPDEAPPEAPPAGRSRQAGTKKPRRAGRKTRSLAAEALAALELPLDKRSPWAAWRWEKFLNPEDAAGGPWKADPRHFQNAAARRLYQAARRAFHQHPFSLDTVFCFIKLKLFEEDLLTSRAEGLGLGMSGKDVSAVLEAQT